MKRLTLLFVALATTLATAFAEPETERNRYTHTYDFQDFITWQCVSMSPLQILRG